MIAIVDLGVSNVGSIHNMLSRIGAESSITSDPAVIESAVKLILPGVGAFSRAMESLRNRNLVSVLNRRVLVDRVPILGICLGMQLLTQGSEEGNATGLGWIDGHAVRFDFGAGNNGLKVPHMGWNTLSIKQPSKILLDRPRGARYYFVHTYRVVCSDPSHVLAVTRYGIEFVSAVIKDNIVGTQFHPEKSHRYGLHLLRNFAQF